MASAGSTRLAASRAASIASRQRAAHAVGGRPASTGGGAARLRGGAIGARSLRSHATTSPSAISVVRTRRGYAAIAYSAATNSRTCMYT